MSGFASYSQPQKDKIALRQLIEQCIPHADAIGLYINGEPAVTMFSKLVSHLQPLGDEQ